MRGGRQYCDELGESLLRFPSLTLDGGVEKSSGLIGIAFDFKP